MLSAQSVHCKDDFLPFNKQSERWFFEASKYPVFQQPFPPVIFSICWWTLAKSVTVLEMGKWCSLGLIDGFFIYKLALVSYKTTLFLPNSSFCFFFFFRLSITLESLIIFIIQCPVNCYFVLVILDDWVAWTANNYFSQSGGREVQGQGLGRFSSWWALSSWFADVSFLTVLTWWRERSTIFLFLERTDPIMRAPPYSLIST